MMTLLNRMVEVLYWALTDFCVYAGNALGLSYYDFNMILFILLIPASVVALPVLVLFKRWLAKRPKK